jgi:hypothetical protein
MSVALAAAGTDVDVSSDAIREITVTVQRRTENMQYVPIAIQALTALPSSRVAVRERDYQLPLNKARLRSRR